MARLTAEQLHTRLERFRTFLKDQGYSWVQGERSKYNIIVFTKQELTKVFFVRTSRNVFLCGRQGQLRESLLS